MKRPPRGTRVRPRAEVLEDRHLLSASATYLGLSNQDAAGPTASIGPGGVRNLEVRISLPVDDQGRASRLDSVAIQGPNGMRWSQGDLSRADAAIVVVPEPFQSGDPERSFDLFFSPTVQVVDPTTGTSSLVTLPHQAPGATTSTPTVSTLRFTVSYTSPLGVSTTETALDAPGLRVPVADLDGQDLRDPGPAVPVLDFATVTGTYAGQGADGQARINLSGLPTTGVIDTSSLVLSDVAGQSWNVGSTGGRWELGSTLTTSSVPGRATLAFPPLRDESGTTMTMTFRLQGATTQYVVDVAIPANSGMDPNRRDGGPVDPTTQALTIRPTTPATPGMVSYVDTQGTTQVVALQTLVNPSSSYHRLIMAPGPDGSVFTLDQRLDIRTPTILQASSPDVTLNFTFTTVAQGAINFYSSHITLDGMKIRFSQPSVNFTFNGWADATSVAIISNRQENGQVPHVDLNLLNLDIQAPYVPFGPNPSANGAIPTIGTFDTGPYASGVVSGNTIQGGTVMLQGGPWTVANNKVVGAVAGTVSDSAFSMYGVHDVQLIDNLVSNVNADLAPGDGPRTGAIDRLVTGNHGSYALIISGNTVRDHVGLIPPNPGGFSQGDPRNSPEMMVFEGYGKWFEGSIDAAAVSSGPSSGTARRVVSVSAEQVARFTTGWGPLALVILNGPDAGTSIPVVQLEQDSASVHFVLGSSLPAGSFDFTVVPAHIGLAITDNHLDLRGTISTGVVLSSSILDATITGNTFLGDQSVEQDGHGNFIANKAIRFEVFVKYDDARPNSYLPMSATIADNTITDAVGGVSMYLERGFPASFGRTYGFLRFQDNKFQYSYPNPAIVTTQFGDSFAGIVNNRAVHDSDAQRFADPGAIRVISSGNTVRWTGGDAPSSYTVVRSITVNGTLYGKTQTYATDPLIATVVPTPVDPPPPTPVDPPPTTTPVDPPPTPTPVDPPPTTPPPDPVVPDPSNPPSTRPTIPSNPPTTNLPPASTGPINPGMFPPLVGEGGTGGTTPTPAETPSPSDPAATPPTNPEIPTPIVPPNEETVDPPSGPGETLAPHAITAGGWQTLFRRVSRRGTHQFLIVSELLGIRSVGDRLSVRNLRRAARR